MAVLLTPSLIRQSFLRTIDSFENHLDSFVLRPGRDFTRHRRLPLKDLVLLMMSMEKSSIGGEIHRFFNLRYPERSMLSRPSASAFIRQRAKLNDDFFPALLNRFNARFPFKKTKFGLHLLACDGTDLNIPAVDDPDTFIPFNSKVGGYHQFHTVAFFDLLEKRFTDAIVQPRTLMDENDACVALVNRNPISGPCLFIADRGFNAFNTMAAISLKNQFFLFRLKDPDSQRSPFHHLVDPERKEFDIDSELFFARSTKPLRNLSPLLCRRLHTQRRFDFIPSDDKSSVFHLVFRFVCFRLDTGNYEFLITNLPRHRCSLSDLKQLYHLRWGIETSFLFLKHNLCLNTPHSIRRDFLRQEIFVKLIMFNFCSLLLSAAGVPPQTGRYPCCFSFSNSIRIARRCIVLYRQPPDFEIIAAIQRFRYPVRSNKDRPRNMRSQRLNHLQNRA